MGSIHVGVAGWDYLDWKGVVYPARVPARFDRLAYLSRFVDVIEINSTFYRDAAPSTTASWVRRTRERADFRFTAKAHRSWTHDEPAGDLAAAVARTLSGLGPLRESGMLGAVLVQFPQRFHRGRDALDRLERLVEHAAGWPLVVEVRHVSWDRDDTAGWLRERGVGWCAVDQPSVGRSTAPVRPRLAAGPGYLRLHGRNRDDWFREDAGRDARYDYLYGWEELQDLAGVAERIARSADELFVVQNNHFRGQAVVNALQMKHLLAGVRPAAPEPLVRAYPALARVVSETQARLF